MLEEGTMIDPHLGLFRSKPTPKPNRPRDLEFDEDLEMREPQNAAARSVDVVYSKEAPLKITAVCKKVGTRRGREKYDKHEITKPYARVTSHTASFLHCSLQFEALTCSKTSTGAPGTVSICKPTRKSTVSRKKPQV